MPINERKKILLVASYDKNLRPLEGLLKRYATVRRIENTSELQRNLSRAHWDVAVSSWSFDNGMWKQAVEQAREQAPGLPVVSVPIVAAKGNGLRCSVAVPLTF